MSEQKHYPFSYHQGMGIVRCKPKKSITSDIKRLFSNHEVSEDDTLILHSLCKYKYLNAFLIRILLEQHMASCNQNYVNKRLLFLESRGLINRLQFNYIDTCGKEHKTPYVFEAAYKTKQLFQKRVNVAPEEDLDCILRNISFNQFHIFLEKQLGNALRMSSPHFNSLSDGAYSVFSNNKRISFYVFSIRSVENWQKTFLSRLDSLLEYLRNNSISFSAIIVICENEMQSLIAERYRMSVKDVKDAAVYYICDYAAVSEGDILSHLIYVHPEKDFSTYDIIRIPVDGNIHINEKKMDSCDTQDKK